MRWLETSHFLYITHNLCLGIFFGDLKTER